MNTEKHMFLDYIIYGICSDVAFGLYNGIKDANLFDNIDDFITFKRSVFLELHKYADSNDTLFKNMIFTIPVIKKIVFTNLQHYIPIKIDEIHECWTKGISKI